MQTPIFSKLWRLAAMLTAVTLLSAAAAFAGDKPILGHTIFGSGAEKVLVLHSWVDDAASYDTVKPYLDTKKFTYVFADVRGYGKSKALTGEYTADEIADDALRLADALKWTRFHLVGHSMTGMAAQRLAINDWQSGMRRLKSVIAITPVTADGYPADEATRKFLWDLIHDRELTEQAFAALSGQRLLPAWTRIKADRHLASSRAGAVRGYYKMWMDGDFSADAVAAKVGTPIRVIGGRQDLPGFQEDKYRSTFVDWYPNVDLKFITDAGHHPMQETPVYLATLIEDHLLAHR